MGIDQMGVDQVGSYRWDELYRDTWIYKTNTLLQSHLLIYNIKVITKLPNSEQSYKGKVQTHNYINRQNQSTTGKLWIQIKAKYIKNTQEPLWQELRETIVIYIYKKNKNKQTNNNMYICKIINIKYVFFSLKSHSRFWQNNNAYSH